MWHFAPKKSRRFRNIYSKLLFHTIFDTLTRFRNLIINEKKSVETAKHTLVKLAQQKKIAVEMTTVSCELPSLSVYMEFN